MNTIEPKTTTCEFCLEEIDFDKVFKHHEVCEKEPNDD